MHFETEKEPNSGDEFSSLSFDSDRRAVESTISEEFTQPDRAGGVWIKDIRFNSIQEAACAVCLEIYVPSFQIRYEEQYEIPMRDHSRGTRKSIDFLVEDTFVEYHPPRRSKKKGEPVQTTEEYRSERLRLISEQGELSGRKLIVAESPEQFYDKVITRFALELPSKEDFMNHFSALCKHISGIQKRSAA